MPTLQTCASAAARAGADVPGAITATRQTNAQAKARELIMIFVNFVFIVVLSFRLTFVVLAFFWLLILRSYLWPFTEVLGRIWRFVTRKKTETLRTTDCTDIPDKGRPRKQKETKVAKVVRNQVRSESCLLPSLSSVRKEAIWRRAPYPFVLSALLSCKFIAACEDCFHAKV